MGLGRSRKYPRQETVERTLEVTKAELEKAEA